MTPSVLRKLPQKYGLQINLVTDGRNGIAALLYYLAFQKIWYCMYNIYVYVKVLNIETGLSSAYEEVV